MPFISINTIVVPKRYGDSKWALICRLKSSLETVAPRIKLGQLQRTLKTRQSTPIPICCAPNGISWSRL